MARVTMTESAATILRALDLGINFLDTADMYGIGDNEELVGQDHSRPPRRGLSRHQIRERPHARTIPTIGASAASRTT